MTNMPSQSFAERSARFVNEGSAWIAGNSGDILIAIGVAAVIIFVMLGLRAFGHRLVKIERDGIDWRTIVGRVLSKTTMFFIVMCALELVAEHAQTPPGLLRTINVLFVIAAAFQGAIWARELILCLVQHKVGEDDSQSNLGSAIGIIRLLVTVALFAIAIIVILDNLGVNVTGLVAGLGIGGIAIGLAAKGIFDDLFSALSIIFDRPFRRGDGIRFDQVNGSVEDIGLKTTRIRSVEGEEVVISNTNLLAKEIHNFTRLDHRRFTLRFGVVYQTPPEKLEAIPAMAEEIVRAKHGARFVRCGLTGFSASALDFELQFEVRTTDYEAAFATRSIVCIEILRRFADEKIEFAYPSTTNFTAAPDGTLIMPYPPAKKVGAEDLKS